jgi:putative ABC transport system substrate-binding protein
MKRREFIALVGGVVAVWPLGLRAQQNAMPVIGVLSGGSPTARPHLVAAFRKGLSETGYVEGQNVAFEYSGAGGQYERLPELAADLVRRQVAVIFVKGTIGARAAKGSSSTIPIVFSSGGDMVKLGLVVSLNKPGGNATGVNLFTQEVEEKKLELLCKLLPTDATVAFLVNPNNPGAEVKTKEIRAAARSLGRQLHVVDARTEIEIDAAFGTLVQLRAGSLVVANDLFFDDTRREQFVALAARFALPAIYGQREYSVDGGLMSYGTNLREAYRQVGIYTGRILRGEKPADLPVVQPTKFEFVINLKTARTLGIEMPPTLLATADEVIE